MWDTALVESGKSAVDLIQFRPERNADINQVNKI